MRPAPPDPQRTWRTALAVLALALLLPGLAGPHGHVGADREGLHDEGSAPLARAYFPAASHPGLPLHLEGAAEGEVRPCTVCLQSFHTRAGQPEHAALVTPPDRDRPLPAAVPGPLARRRATAAAGRAPPLS